MLWEAVYVASYQDGHLHGQLFLFLQKLRVVVLIRRDDDSVGISVKCELLALLLSCGSALLCHFERLECAISVIIVKQVSLVAFVQSFFYVFKAQLTAILADGLQLALRKKTVDFGYFGNFLDLCQFLEII